MSKIIWKGIIKSEDDFPTADIPKNAKKIDSEEDMIKMQIKALPFMIPSVLICPRKLLYPPPFIFTCFRAIENLFCRRISSI